MNDPKVTKDMAGMILPRLDAKFENEEANEILAKIDILKDYLIKRLIWIFGGDGLIILDRWTRPRISIR